MEQPAYLVLENGTVWKGIGFGAQGDTVGEVVFTTAMTGYLETITDPSYFGQIVMQTFPLIGNYGVIPEDFESDRPYIKGYIVNQWCHAPSNFRMEGKLDAFFKEREIIGLYGIDTRALTKVIRNKGVMNGMITADVAHAQARMEEIRAYMVRDAVANASRGKRRFYQPEAARCHVVLWDFGAKENMIRELVQRGCRVTVVPWNTKAQEILSLSPDGVLLSNGPGDPAENTGIIAEIALLCERRLPLFGICLGHQLLALARGAKTSKLHFGHRGANQPVRETATGRVYITSQNHGYAVESDSLPAGAVVSYANANDGTCEGVDYMDIPAASVQFHPEGAGGPRDTRFLFDRFVERICH